METAETLTVSRKLHWRLFATCWFLYVLHFATNIEREIYPALSLGDHLSFDVSEYLGLHPDIFTHTDGAAYINNNPGVSILGAVPYSVFRPLISRISERVQRARSNQAAPPQATYDSPWPLARQFAQKTRERGLDIKLGLAAGVMQALLMAPLSALSVVLMYTILANRLPSPRGALFLALLFGFATPVFYRTAQLNHNLLVAHCGLVAFALLWRPWDRPDAPRRPRYLLAGAIAGWAVVCDFTGVVVVAVLGIYGLVRRSTLPQSCRRSTDALLFVGGLLLSGSVLMSYQWTCFGHPFLPAQHYMPSPPHGYGKPGWPEWELILRNAFDYRYGLFLSSPLLLLAIYRPGWAASHRKITGRLEAGCILAMTIGLFVFCGCIPYGYLQFNTGVRYMVPLVPFLFLIVADVLWSMPTKLAIAAGCLGIAWSWCLAMYREVELGAGILEAPLHILREGPQFPWLTTLQRMGYVSSSWIPIAIMLATAAVIGTTWRQSRAKYPAAESSATSLSFSTNLEQHA